MKVNEILTESTAPAFDGNFPIAMKAVEGSSSARYATKLKVDFETIKAAFAAGEIINTQVQPIKDHVNGFVKAAFDAVIDYAEVRPTDPNERHTPIFDELYGALSCWDLRGMVASYKRLQKVSKEAKATKIYKTAMALFDELMPLVKVMEHIKAITVMASAKKAEAKAAKAAEEGEYKKKYTDHKDVKKVIAILKKVSVDVEQDLYESMAKAMKASVEKFKKSEDTDYTEAFKRDGFTRMILQSLTERDYEAGKGFRDRKKYFKLIKGWEAKLDEMAKKDASDIVDKFVYKNSGKLSFIIFTKNNLKAVTLKNVTVGRGAVEATLHLEFADGSEFTAESSVELAFSVLGKPFYRYPTRFSSVKLPDGSRMGQPSEQRMDEVFAITK